MGHMVIFSRTRSTIVENISSEEMRSSCVLRDTSHDAWVEITVMLPDLEIKRVQSEVKRWKETLEQGAEKQLQHAVGIRIGPGMLKIIQGLSGNGEACRELFFMLEECCQAVILSFTKDVLVKSPRPTEAAASKVFYNKMVRENIRLYNRCAAFAPGSSLVEGIELSRTDDRDD